MGISVSCESHVPEVKLSTEEALARAYEIIGLKAEGYAKKLCPVGTSESTGIPGYRGGTLRNSITHISSKDGMTIGSNVVYAPFVELGTGPYFQVPPEWEQFEQYTPSGVPGAAYVRPRPFLRPAILEHQSEYEDIIKNELSKVQV